MKGIFQLDQLKQTSHQLGLQLRSHSKSHNYKLQRLNQGPLETDYRDNNLAYCSKLGQ